MLILSLKPFKIADFIYIVIIDNYFDKISERKNYRKNSQKILGNIEKNLEDIKEIYRNKNNVRS